MVLFVGRLVPYKGVDVLLRALVGVPATTVIVGGGPSSDALRAQAAALGHGDRVVFIDELDDADVTALYHACDMFVLPSVASNEAFGVVQLEAMICGKPVISTDLPTGVPWVNRHGETGLVVPPRDAEALRAAIMRLLGEPALRLKLGEQGRRRALADFTIEGMVSRTTAVYRELVAPAGDLAILRDSPAKRLFDIALAGFGLLLSSPLWLIFALAVKLQDGGPVFFAQARVGRGGRRFRGLKFRSMVPDADRRFGPVQAAANDARITRVGRLLRATAMDELPQLWNILRGDMSFVGPRALMPEEVEVGASGERVPIEKIPGYEQRHRVRPGLTGVAQIYADRDVPRRQKFRYDALYIRRRGFRLDIRLIAVSFWITFRGRWERRGNKL